MALIPRAHWGAPVERPGYHLPGPVNEVYIHHFNSGISPVSTVEEGIARCQGADRYHAGLGWNGIGYSWLVDNAGNMYEGRGWDQTGAHTFAYNSRGYGICALLDSNTTTPSDACLQGIAQLILMGIVLVKINDDPTIVAHRDRVPDTSCCGDPMYGQIPTIIRHVGGLTPITDPTTPTPATAIPRDNEDFDMRACLTQGGSYLLVGSDRTFTILNQGDDSWELVNSRLVGLARAGLIPSHPDGSPVIGRLADDALALLTDRTN